MGSNIKIRNKLIFWGGFTSVCVGVLLQLPMYISASDVGYRLVGMTMSTTMDFGMALELVGFLAVLYSLLPASSSANKEVGYNLKIRTLDDAPINLTHAGLLFVMAAAITIDVMKPTILSFIAPGVAREYGLRAPVNPAGTIPVALLPLAGIAGTFIGSFIWGWMGDKIGRRSSMLLAGIDFIATSECGCMPTFWMNCVMCFFMGLGVGGMLPIMFTLMAESIPARHRSWIMVLIGGDVAGAYIITSALASWLVPHFSWRILWLIGIPSGFILILLTHWIPESPRYLLGQGRVEEAKRIMERFGAKIVKEKPIPKKADIKTGNHFRQLLQPPYTEITAAIVILAIGSGFVEFGFQLWIPSNLQHLGFSEAGFYKLLRNAALIGFPLNFAVAWLYGFWNSKGTIILLALLTAAAMFGFLFAGNAIVQYHYLLYILLIIPIWGISSVVAVLSAYAAEIYHTRIRSRGSGLVAGVSKFGGVLVIIFAVLAVTPPSITTTALVGAISLIIAAAAIIIFGIETQKRQLEEITEEQEVRIKDWVSAK
jgi:putative MFS transporter